MLILLKDSHFYAKRPKCTFGVNSVDYLGHIISSQGVCADPSKVQAVLDWPAPKSLMALRGFLRLMGYYHRFTSHYATIARPLTENFTWSHEAASTFSQLKVVMASTPDLRLLNFNEPFQIDTEASAIVVGAVLSQRCHPLAYFNKKMSPKMQVTPAYVREMYTITEAVKKWRQYLLGICV